MAKDSFIFYRSFFEAIKNLKEKDRLKIYDAICEKSLNNNEITLTGIAGSMFTLIKPQIEANNQKYENGKKGGRPKNNQDKTTGFENDNKNQKPKQNQNKTTGFENHIKNKNQNETETKPNQNLKKTKTKANENAECIMKMNNENVNENAECKMIMECYEENIGILTPASAELLLSYLDDLTAEMIVQAIKIATQRNKRSARYIQGILADWERKGYKTLADIQQENKNSSKKDSKEKKEEAKIHFAEFVSMTNAEYEKLISTYGNEFTDQCVKILDNYKGASGKKYKSDYRAILSWVIEKLKNQKISDYEREDAIKTFENLEALYEN